MSNLPNPLTPADRDRMQEVVHILESVRDDELRAALLGRLAVACAMLGIPLNPIARQG